MAVRRKMKTTVREELGEISAYRSALMGAAILLVVIYHAPVESGIHWMDTLKKFCYGGVDVFFFISGFGIHRSLSQNDVKTFYEHRLRRLIPPYLPLMLMWFALDYWVSPRLRTMEALAWKIRDFLGNVVMTGWPGGADSQYAWYVQAIFWFYLASPLLFECVRWGTRSRARFAALMTAAAVFTVALLGTPVMVGSSRLIVFLLGMTAAQVAREQREDACRRANVNLPVVYLLAFAGIWMLWLIWRDARELFDAFGLWWHPFILITPGICSLLSRLFRRMEKCGLGNRALRILKMAGESSLEIYLMHLLVFDALTKRWPVTGKGWWLIIMAASVLLGILYAKGIKKVCRLLE